MTTPAAHGSHASEVVADLTRSGYDPRLAGAHGTFRFDVEDAGSWRLRVDNGSFEILDGGGAADLVLACDEQAFIDLVQGRLNFVTALLRGLIRADGDLAMALRFHGLYRSALAPNAADIAEARP